MPILGIVLTLDPASPEDGRRVLERLAGVSGLELGERRGAKQPAVLECAHDPLAKDFADSNEEVEAKIEALRQIEGVMYVDVVFAEFADLLPDEAAGSSYVSVEPRSKTAEPRIEMERD